MTASIANFVRHAPPEQEMVVSRDTRGSCLLSDREDFHFPRDACPKKFAIGKPATSPTNLMEGLVLLGLHGRRIVQTADSSAF